MNIKLLVLIIVVIGVFIICLQLESFMDVESDIIEFTRSDGDLIKKFKVSSTYSFDTQEVLNLFKKDESININIPDNYTMNIIYNGGKTIVLSEGTHEINKVVDNKTIDQIDIKYNLDLSDQTILVKNYNGDILYSNFAIYPVDWDQIYTQYGYDNYYVYYPSGIIRPYYYYYHPRYKLYKSARNYPYSTNHTYPNPNPYNPTNPKPPHIIQPRPQPPPSHVIQHPPTHPKYPHKISTSLQKYNNNSIYNFTKKIHRRK